MKRKKSEPEKDIMFLLLFPAVLFSLCYVSYFYGVVDFEAALIIFALLLGVAMAIRVSVT